MCLIDCVIIMLDDTEPGYLPSSQQAGAGRLEPARIGLLRNLVRLVMLLLLQKMARSKFTVELSSRLVKGVVAAKPGSTSQIGDIRSCLRLHQPPFTDPQLDRNSHAFIAKLQYLSEAGDQT